MLFRSLDVEVDRDGKIHTMSFKRGVPGLFDGDGPDAEFTKKSGLVVAGRAKKGVTGTRVRYWADPQIFVKGSPDKSVAISDLFLKLPMGAPGYEYGPFLENGSDLVGGAMFYPQNERGPRGEPLPKVGFSYCSQAVDLEVDVETGRIKIHKLVSILDPGKPINDQLAIGQIEGGEIGRAHV